jgi:hypothetical protein
MEMATAKKAGITGDAIAMLEADHKKVQKAFKDFETLKESGKKRDKATKEEQNETFPKVRKTKLDLTVLGQQIAQRKAQLESET